jgi:hypothetical protein
MDPTHRTVTDAIGTQSANIASVRLNMTEFDRVPQQIVQNLLQAAVVHV